MNDEQCNAIIEAMGKISDQLSLLCEKVEEIPTYYDYELRASVERLVEVIRDIKDFKL